VDLAAVGQADHGRDILYA